MAGVGALGTLLRQFLSFTFSFLVFLLVNLAVDLLYAVIDPRIEYR